MGTSSEMVFNGSGKGYLPAGTICNRTHIPSEWLKADAEFKQPKKGHRPAPMPLKRTHFLSYKPYFVPIQTHEGRRPQRPHPSFKLCYIPPPPGISFSFWYISASGAAPPGAGSLPLFARPRRWCHSRQASPKHRAARQHRLLRQCHLPCPAVP